MLSARVSAIRQLAVPVGLAVAICVSLITPAVSQAANPVAFASANGTCTHTGPGRTIAHYDSGPVPANHQNVIARYVTDAPATWNFNQVEAAGPDSIWTRVHAVNAGDSEAGTVECTERSGTVHFRADYYNVPTASTSFSGANTFRSDPSTLPFKAPGEAQYVANLSLRGGAVTLKSPARGETFASSGLFQLGTLQAGDEYVDVSALEGPQAIWSLRVHALPVALSGVRWGRRAVQPGKLVQLRYTVSGDTSVTAAIQDRDGRVVRTLAEDFAVSRGDHTLTWDGRDTSGALLPDGPYTAQITTQDPSGASKTAHASIQLDAGPETYWTKKPPKVSHRHRVEFAFAATEPRSTFQCKYSLGWKQCTSPKVFHLRPGRYEFAVRATDRYGVTDSTPATWRFRIRR